jgi:hypothetical protein
MSPRNTTAALSPQMTLREFHNVLVSRAIGTVRSAHQRPPAAANQKATRTQMILKNG